MMNSKEKAKELIWKYLPVIDGWTGKDKTGLAKECALLCVNEVIETLYDEGYDEFDAKIIRWLEVKDELETFN